MISWVLRAVALGALVVGLRTALGFGMVHWPTHGAWMRLLCLVVLLAAVLAWGVLDGRRDRIAHGDPERGADLTILWLKAAVAGGLGSGAVAWILDFLPKIDLGDNGLLFELTAGASFIILLIFIPALIGVGIGRRLAGRKSGGDSTSHLSHGLPAAA
ncbi:B-4DMT family transporter [Nocardia bovistercoris]|uniref:B-4DMT family transporter n=1 Tax=Nocardia bovistercoris TaxID=2785916 RepID=A0A931N1G7_9NOCA|nr:B-4DMT family transporter [Nocardia bovistercoris]MBH0774921.1 B-4DMT family transporter [Nocardia bovistercoris]